MNYQEIKAKLIEITDDESINTFVEYLEEGYEEVDEAFGVVEKVQEIGPYDGHECINVFHFKEHDVYVRFGGYYSSYNGARWNSIEEVFPYEKKIIAYSTTKKG